MQLKGKGKTKMTTFSFRASAEFVEETKSLATILGLSSADYVREAVAEKNKRLLAERIVFLSKKLSAESRAVNGELEGAVGDGLEEN